MNKTVYCAKCKKETTHQASVERGDIIFACQSEGCDRFVKFPATLSAVDLQAAISDHKKANEGLQYIETEEQLIEAGLMTKQQVDAALAAIASL